MLRSLAGFQWTGASLNPVRSLAPCIVNRSFTHYHWIYWVGPITGTILAVLIYKLVKALEYETAQGEEKGDEYQPVLPRTNRRQSSLPLPSVHSVDVPSAEPKKGAAPPPPPPAAPKKPGDDMPTCYAD